MLSSRGSKYITLSALLFMPAFALAEEPATLPASSQPVATSDETTAINALADAFDKGDTEAAKKVFAPTGDQITVDDYVSYAVAVSHLNDAAKAKWGQATAPILPPIADLLRQLAKTSTPKITGDEAVMLMNFNGKDVPVLGLKKIAGSWKVTSVPVASTSISPKDWMRQDAKSIQQTADDVQAGKVQSADEATALANSRMK